MTVDLAVLARGIALVAKPRAFRAPVGVVRLPLVFTSAAEAEDRSAHGLDRDVAGEDEQIRPGNLVAVFLLDRPKQAARLVEVAVVWPGVERSKTLLSVPAA